MTLYVKLKEVKPFDYSALEYEQFYIEGIAFPGNVSKKTELMKPPLNFKNTILEFKKVENDTVINFLFRNTDGKTNRAFATLQLHLTAVPRDRNCSERIEWLSNKLSKPPIVQMQLHFDTRGAQPFMVGMKKGNISDTSLKFVMKEMSKSMERAIKANEENKKRQEEDSSQINIEKNKPPNESLVEPEPNKEEEKKRHKHKHKHYHHKKDKENEEDHSDDSKDSDEAIKADSYKDDSDDDISKFQCRRGAGSTSNSKFNIGSGASTMQPISPQQYQRLMSSPEAAQQIKQIATSRAKRYHQTQQRMNQQQTLPPGFQMGYQVGYQQAYPGAGHMSLKPSASSGVVPQIPPMNGLRQSGSTGSIPQIPPQVQSNPPVAQLPPGIPLMPDGTAALPGGAPPPLPELPSFKPPELPQMPPSKPPESSQIPKSPPQLPGVIPPPQLPNVPPQLPSNPPPQLPTNFAQLPPSPPQLPSNPPPQMPNSLQPPAPHQSHAGGQMPPMPHSQMPGVQMGFQQAMNLPPPPGVPQPYEYGVQQPYYPQYGIQVQFPPWCQTPQQQQQYLAAYAQFMAQQQQQAAQAQAQYQPGYQQFMAQQQAQQMRMQGNYQSARVGPPQPR